MIALDYYIVIIYRRYETRTIDEMGGIRTQAPKFASMFYWYGPLALPTTLTSLVYRIV
jgi:NADH-quinone oxidoreductase subunit M